MVIIPTHNIVALDRATKVIKEASEGEDEGKINHITLREAIMGLKSTEDNNMNLFRSVDQNTEIGRVVFVVNQKVETEAREVITVLPLILEKKYGGRIWTWFMKEAAEAVVGYK